MLPILAVLALVLVLVAACSFATWLFRADREPADDGEDEETFWADPREWSFLGRFFGQPPPRLTDRRGAPPAD